MHPKGKSWLLVLVLCGASSLCSSRAFAQAASANLPDSPSQTSSDAHRGGGPAAERQVSWRSLPKDFLHDQKGIWLFPLQVAKGRYVLPALAVTGVTAGLIAADPHAMPYFQSHKRNLDDINDVFDTSTTTAEVVALPLSLLLAGYARHDSYQVGTAQLAGEAYADAAILDLGIKAITRRKRPVDVAPGQPFRDTFFAGGKSPFKGSSFPSGHAAGVFAVTTIVATRYRNHRWVPFVLYGFATAISVSRISTLAHFPSDVFLGAALGYTVARYDVLRPR